MNTIFSFLFLLTGCLGIIFFVLWLISIIKKASSKKKLIASGISFALCIAALIGFGVTMTPEQRARAEEQRLQEQAEREAKKRAEAEAKEATLVATPTPLITSEPVPTQTPTTKPVVTKEPVSTPESTPVVTSKLDPSSTSEQIVALTSKDKEYDSLQQFFIDSYQMTPAELELKCDEMGIYWTCSDKYIGKTSYEYTLSLDEDTAKGELNGEYHDYISARYNAPADGENLIEITYYIRYPYRSKPTESWFAATHIFSTDHLTSDAQREFFKNVEYYATRAAGTALSEKEKIFTDPKSTLDIVLENKERMYKYYEESKGN